VGHVRPPAEFVGVAAAAVSDQSDRVPPHSLAVLEDEEREQHRDDQARNDLPEQHRAAL
jgi:hypothetical protein